MNYEKFKEIIMETLDGLADLNGYSMVYESVLKNNGQKLDAVIVKSNVTEIAPTLYLENWYDEYLRGKEISEICEEIFSLVGQIYKDNKFPEIPNMEWDSVKDNLYVSVINADANEELLKDVPHRRIGDLAIIPKITVNKDDLSSGVIRVSNHVLGVLGKTKDEVLNQAIANTEKMNFSCRNITEVLRDMLATDNDLLFDNEMFPDSMLIPMYVVTNENNVDGAGILACREMLANVVEQVGGDIYVLPSSIHELILVPKDNGVDLEDLQEIVRDINRNVVTPGEILSDNVYQFNSLSKKLSIVTGTEELFVEKMRKTMHKKM